MAVSCKRSDEKEPLGVLREFRSIEKFEDAIQTLACLREIFMFGEWQHVALLATLFRIAARDAGIRKITPQVIQTLFNSPKMKGVFFGSNTAF